MSEFRRSRPNAQSTAHASAPDDGADALLDADDARHLLLRTGFAPREREVEPYVGLTREQAVARLVGGARSEALTPLPAWTIEAPPNQARRDAWTPEERQQAQRQRGVRYDELRAWWL